MKENKFNFLDSQEAKYYLRYLIFAIITGITVFLPMMSKNLVNNVDGIWHPSNFIAGDWEISLGRGLQRYADRARFGLVTSSWNSILVFILIGLSDILIIKKFNLKNTVFAYFLVFLSIANPVTSESLSYSYMSVNFALALFFSALAFALINPVADRKMLILTSLLAALSFAISMAFYQAYIGVFAVMCTFMAITYIKELKKAKEILIYLANCLIVFACGGVFYMIITKLLLFRADIEMASYRGADGISPLSILTSLPYTFIYSYQEFFTYVFTKQLKARLEFSQIMIGLLSVCFAILLIFQFIKLCKKKVSYAVSFLLLTLLLPAASCIICMVAVGNAISGLMAMGIVYLILGFFLLISDSPKSKVAYGIVVTILAWYYVGAVENDQIALEEGITATRTITQEIVADLNDSQLLPNVRCVAFMGRLAENPYFYKSQAYEMSNEYAQFGRWSTDTRNNRVTWAGITNMFCGVNIPICYDEAYDALRFTDEVAQMPVYPNEGYIKQFGDILVVKASDLY